MSLDKCDKISCYMCDKTGHVALDQTCRDALRMEDHDIVVISNPDSGKKEELLHDKIHPIFMDTIARNSLDVKILYPVKIRKNFSRQFWKTMNRFGSVSLVAFAVTLGFLGTILTTAKNDLLYSWCCNASIWMGWLWDLDFAITLFLGGWAIWSVLTPSKYRSD